MSIIHLCKKLYQSLEIFLNEKFITLTKHIECYFYHKTLISHFYMSLGVIYSFGNNSKKEVKTLLKYSAKLSSHRNTSRVKTNQLMVFKHK